MKIDGVSSVNATVSIDSVNKLSKSKPIDKVKEIKSVIYDKDESVKGKDLGHSYDKNTIANLRRDSEKAYAYLRGIVENMLKQQGKTFESLKDDDAVKVDENTRIEAQALIAEDGLLGVEAVSQRLVDFAIAISGGDKSKASNLRNAIDKGFKEAEKMLGGLPDISKETYKVTMEKFDNWFNEK